MEEMRGIVSKTTPLRGRSLERAKRALNYVGEGDKVAEADVRKEFAGYFEAVA
jgi:beta-N-acetylhexosaminidase